MKIKRHSILGLSTMFLAPDTGGASGGAAKPSLEKQLATAQSDLAAAQASVSSLTSERDKTLGDLQSITAERDSLRSQFDALTAESTKLRSDLTTAQATISTLTVERDTARQQHTVSEGNVSRLEALCNIKGIDSKQAVPPASQPDALSESDFATRISAAKSPAERAKIASEFEAAVAAGKI